MFSQTDLLVFSGAVYFSPTPIQRGTAIAALTALFNTDPLAQCPWRCGTGLFSVVGESRCRECTKFDITTCPAGITSVLLLCYICIEIIENVLIGFSKQA